MRRSMLLVVLILLAPAISRAQPLIQHVPADAILYAGWQGAAAMPPAYQQSHLKAVVDASNFHRVVDEFLPALLARISRDRPADAAALNASRIISTTLWRRPSAFYFTGIDWQAGPPRPRAVLLCQAGPDADALFQQFTRFAAQAQPHAPFPLRAFRKADLVSLSVGFEQETDLFPATPVPSLSTVEPFRQALAHAQKDPVFILYEDAQALLRVIDNGMTSIADERTRASWQRFRDAAQLAAIHRVILTAGFDQQDWSTQLFIAAPAPRPGLWSLVDAQPVSDEMLRAIPRSATCVVVDHFDLARLVAEARNLAGRIDPRALQYFDMALGGAQLALALDVQKGLLEPLGDEWALYNDPNASGSGPLGLTLLNRLRQPPAAQRALTRLELFVDNTVNGQLQSRRMQVTFDQVKVGDLAVHTAMTPVVAPSWAIRGNFLFAALYPQLVISAADAAAAPDQSLLQNPAFQAVRQRLNVAKPTGILFLDLPQSGGNFYQSLLAATQAALGMADLYGVKAPPLVLPPLHRLRPHLTPAAMAWWADDAGFHAKSITPFPGAGLLAAHGSILMAAPGFLAFGYTSHSSPAVSTPARTRGPVQLHEQPQPREAAPPRQPAAPRDAAPPRDPALIEVAPQVQFANPELARSFAFAAPRLQRSDDGLAVSWPARAVAAQVPRAEYRAVFLDAAGKAVEEGNWTPLPPMPRNQPVTLQFSSSTADAANVRLEIRRAP